MPIAARSRPIAVTALSLIAFATSPAFIVLLGVFFFNLYTEGVTPSFSQDPGAFVWLFFWQTIVSACFLMLSWISYTAGLDLWRLKDRGRKLAYVSMIPYLPLGIGFLLSSDIWRKILGLAFLTLGGFFLMYLRKPATAEIFAPLPPDPPR
jgi:hypothetical protein